MLADSGLPDDGNWSHDVSDPMPEPSHKKPFFVQIKITHEDYGTFGSCKAAALALAVALDGECWTINVTLDFCVACCCD